ncbi:MAG: cytochrome-c oxidase, cbb3-type subunit III [Gammaproteobacteria bacterium]|jgi:cytochrome c oxidase cbb3-type subunit 3
MPDTLSGFWTWFIALPTLGGLIGLLLLIWWLSGKTGKQGDEVPTMGHVWDDDLEEYNNPLPRWWLILFIGSIIFAVVYLLLYPGLGAFQGVLGWSQQKQYETEVAKAAQRYAPLYERYRGEAIPALAQNPEARKMGERLFASYCTVCHGSDARGGPGFPNLTDDAWLYGGAPEVIETSILDGRSGVMPSWKAALGGDQGVRNVAQYVLSLSGREVDEQAAAQGKPLYMAICVSCHMPDGTGNQALGAPNLTDNAWLYGGSPAAVQASIANGRQGKMPAQREFLGEDKAHVLAAYVYSLSH